MAQIDKSKILKLLKGASAFVILGLVTGFLWWKLYGESFVEKARFTEVKASLASLFTAEKAFFEEYGYYITDLKALGYSPEGDTRTQFYLTKEDVPVDLRNLIPEKDLPFVVKDDYQVLVVYRSGNERTYWKQRKNGNIERVELVHSH